MAQHSGLKQGIPSYHDATCQTPSALLVSSTMSSLKLTYPVYTASFDPFNNDFLFVGGGGGEGRSGIPNKITLLDTSSRETIKEIAQIDLSRDEDSVQSLAVAHSNEASATLYAGINSSLEAQKAGLNEHLRAVRVPYPMRQNAAQPPRTAFPEALSKAALFTAVKSANPETYQKVLRLSPARADVVTRLGAVATRDAPEGEIVLFDASRQTPASSDVLKRIKLGKGQEAGDIDIIEGSDSGNLIAYCTEADVHVIEISSDGQLTDTCVFEGSKRDGSFRSLRFLDRNHIFTVRNAPKKTGAQILIVNVPTKIGKGTIVFGKGLHSGFNAALSADVARLPALDGADRRQYIAAVAGQDNSLVLFTIDQNPKATRQMNMKQHSIFRDLHPAGITSLSFSQFKIPYSGIATKPMKLKLASTSFANTVAVHTFALKSQPNPRQATHQILATPPQRTAKDSLLSLTTGSILVAVICVIMQCLSELRGTARLDLFQIRKWAPLEVKYMFDIPADPRHMGVPEHQWEQHPAIASMAPSAAPEAIEKGKRIAKSIAASKKSASEAAAKASATAAEGIAEAIASMKDAADDIPSADDVREQLKDAAAVIPSIEEITQHVSSAVPKQVKDGSQKVMQAPSEAEKQRKQAFKKIRSILHAHHNKEDQPADVKVPGAVMFKDSEHGVTLSTHEHEDHLEGSGAKKWEDLSQQEQHIWRKRLSDAGHWAEGETEKVLKGVFFGTIAGLVGAAMA